VTPELFNSRHGLQWDAFKKSPMFTDLLRVADDESPKVQMHKISAVVMTENPSALLGSIAGFSLFRSLLLRLGTKETTPEEEADFSTTIEEQIIGEQAEERAVEPKKKKRK
jgi:hypothetical protein